MHVQRLFVAALLAATVLSGGCGGNKYGGKSLHDQVEQAKRNPNPEPRARQLAKIGLQQFDAGDLSGAGETLGEAVRACQEIKDPISRTSALTYVARVEARCGDPRQASALLKQARQHNDKIQSIEVRVSALTKIGRAQGNELRDPSAAAETFKAAEELASQIGDAKSKAVALVEVAEADLKIGKQSETQRLLNSALSIAKSIEDPAKRAAALGEVAAGQEPLLTKGAPRDAFQAAGEAAREVTNDYSRVIAMTELAKRLVDAKRSTEAVKLLAEAKAVLPKIGEVDLHKEADEKIHHVEITLKPAG